MIQSPNIYYILLFLLFLWVVSNALKPILTVWDSIFSFQCVSVCLFCLPLDILCCFNVQICIPEMGIQIQNTIWNTIILDLAVWETLCRFSWLKHTTINNYQWFTAPKFCMKCIEIFQRWRTKVDLSIPECTMWYSQWHLVDA